MHTLTIGMMLPSSSICSMGKSYYKAFKDALNQKVDDVEIEYVTELIGQGGIEKVAHATDAFLGFHEVDLVTGIVSNYSLQHVADRFKKRKTPILYSNLGEHLLPTAGLNDFVFCNSAHLWQQTWLMGFYAAKHLGGKGLVFSALYDSGYSFIESFRLGMLAAKPDAQLDIQLLPMPAAGELSDISGSIDQVGIDEADFVFALFCGEEASNFLEIYKSRGYHKKNKLLGLPFLLEESDKNLEDIDLISFSNSAEEVEDHPFYKSIFSQLGHLSGTLIGEAIVAGKGELDRDILEQVLIKQQLAEFRTTQTPQFKTPINIIEHRIGLENAVESNVILNKSVDLSCDEAFNTSRDMLASSWINPYLCV
ncbi:MAG: ABC transporter substrate-binding protein [Marinifilaceae bacterium]